MKTELIQYQNANESYDEVIANFIVRQKEFARIIDDIKTTKDDESFQHYVFVGRRGSGKSTLLRRIQAEIMNDSKLRKKYEVVNLSEEQSGIYRLYDLWDYVIRDLNAAEFNIDKLDFREYKNDMKEYTKALHGKIISALRLKNKKLILLLDNIDRILDTRGSNDDSSLLRELLINYKDIRIIGGSTIMSEHFWKYDMPFYQFFSIKKLEPLSIKEVEQLLNHWSEKKQLPEIKELIKKHPGKIQSIRMLTDGMPRTMLLFVDMLINRPGQNGYQYLQNIVDKATPIYQERLGLLSPAQRKVLTELAYIYDAASVEELIPKCNMDGKTISSLLNQLTHLRYTEKIRSNTKNNLYRVEERFFNLWFNMTQGGPQERYGAKALTDFLEKWYDSEELSNLCFEFGNTIIKGELNKDYAEPMTHALLNSRILTKDSKEDLYLKVRKSGLVDVNNLKQLEYYIGSFDEAINKAFKENDYSNAIELLNISNIEEGKKNFGLGLSYQELKNYEEAEKYYLIATEKGHVNALYNLAILFREQGKEAEAEKYYLLAIEKGKNDALNELANLYKKQGKRIEAEKYYLFAIEKENNDALFNLANLYREQGKEIEAEKYYLYAIEKQDQDALYNLANLYREQGRAIEAEKYFLEAIAKGNNEALFGLAFLYGEQGKEIEAEKYYLIAAKSGDIKAINNLLLFKYGQNNKADIKNLLPDYNSIILQKLIELNPDLMCILFLYLGDLDRYKTLSDEYTGDVRTISDYLLLNLLIHKQYNWVYNYFIKNIASIDEYKPLYYATLNLLENKEQDLLRMPPEINESVNNILASIRERQQFYYPSKQNK